MPIRNGSVAAALGYVVPEFESEFRSVHFGPHEDVKSKEDIPETGVQVIFVNPILANGFKNRIATSGTARGVLVREEFTRHLRALLEPFKNGAHPEASPAPPVADPTPQPQYDVLAFVIGAESAHTFKQKYEQQGVQFADLGAVKSLQNIPITGRVFLSKVGDDDHHRQLIVRLVESKHIPLTRFTRRNELLDLLDSLIEPNATVAPSRPPSPPAAPKISLSEWVRQRDTDKSIPVSRFVESILSEVLAAGYVTDKDKLKAIVYNVRSKPAAPAGPVSPVPPAPAPAPPAPEPAAAQPTPPPAPAAGAPLTNGHLANSLMGLVKELEAVEVRASEDRNGRLKAELELETTRASLQAKQSELDAALAQLAKLKAVFNPDVLKNILG